MTNMRARNSKLVARSIRIIRAETRLDEAAAQVALARAGDDLPCAIVMVKTGRSRQEAEAAPQAARGVVSNAVETLKRD